MNKVHDKGRFAPETISAPRLAALLADSPLILPVKIGNAVLEIECNGRPSEASYGSLIVLSIGLSRLCVQLPDAVVTGLLNEAPEPVSLDALSEQDFGLLLEHIATQFVEQLEQIFGESVSVLGLLRREVIGPEFDPIGFTIGYNGDTYQAAFFASTDLLRGKIAQVLQAHSAVARSIQKGELVAMGPVILSIDEARAIAVGDVIVMEGARFGRLTGAFIFPDGRARAADLADGFATLKGPEDTLNPGQNVAIYFEVGQAARSGSGQTGTRIQFMPFEGHKIYVRIGAERVGLGELVEAGGSLAISVKTMGAL